MNIHECERVYRTVSVKILSLETDLSSLMTLVTIVFPLLKIASGCVCFFEKLAPGYDIVSGKYRHRYYKASVYNRIPLAPGIWGQSAGPCNYVSLFC